MGLKDVVIKGIIESQNGLRTKLDSYDIELLATNITNAIGKRIKVEVR